MSNRSLVEVARSLMNKDSGHLHFGGMVGKVVKNDDPDKLGRVQLEFDFDYQGTYSIAWAMPVYPLSGQIGMDVPEVGMYLMCIFLIGNPTEPYYLGITRGVPQKAGVKDLVTDDGEGLHLAIAEAVDDGFKRILDWMKSHTHRVTVTPQGLSSTPGTPFAGLPSPAETLAPGQAVPKLLSVKTKRVRVTKANRVTDNDEAEGTT